MYASRCTTSGGGTLSAVLGGWAGFVLLTVTNRVKTNPGHHCPVNFLVWFFLTTVTNRVRKNQGGVFFRSLPIDGGKPRKEEPGQNPPPPRVEPRLQDPGEEGRAAALRPYCLKHN